MRDVLAQLLDGTVQMTTATEMHAAAACSRAAFDRWFLLGVGVPPGRFMRRLAVVRSLEKLVRSPHAALDQIAHEVGYARAGSLNRAWKTETGATLGLAAQVLRDNGRLSRDVEGLLAAARLIDQQSVAA